MCGSEYSISSSFPFLSFLFRSLADQKKDPKQKLPIPKFRCRQWTTRDTNSFGVKYHLKVTIHTHTHTHTHKDRELISLIFLTLINPPPN